MPKELSTNEIYKLKRVRNNVAVKKSREKSRQKNQEILEKMNILRSENNDLESKINDMAVELSSLKKQIIHMVTGKSKKKKINSQDDCIQECENNTNSLRVKPDKSSLNDKYKFQNSKQESDSNLLKGVKKNEVLSFAQCGSPLHIDSLSYGEENFSNPSNQPHLHLLSSPLANMIDSNDNLFNFVLNSNDMNQVDIENSFLTCNNFYNNNSSNNNIENTIINKNSNIYNNDINNNYNDNISANNEINFGEVEEKSGLWSPGFEFLLDNI